MRCGIGFPGHRGFPPGGAERGKVGRSGHSLRALHGDLAINLLISQIDRSGLTKLVHFPLTMLFSPCFSRPHLGSVPDFRFPVADGPTDAYSSSAVMRRPQKGRVAALRDEPSKARAVFSLYSPLFTSWFPDCVGITVSIGHVLFSSPRRVPFSSKKFTFKVCYFFLKNGNSNKI